VLGLASRHATGPVRAFTLSFDRPEYDELGVAREMAEKCGAELTPIPITHADLAEDLPRTIWHAEQPIINANSVAKFRLSRVVRDAGYKVVLTGEGSDEILAGYPHFRRDMLLYDRRGQDPAVADRLLEELGRANSVSRGILLPDGQGAPMEGVRRRLGYVPTFLEAIGSSAPRARRVLSDDFIASHGTEGEPLSALLDSLDVHGQLEGRSPVDQSLYLWSKTALPNFILSVLGDRMEMAHSIEGRLPFLDHHVVETVRAFPVSAKIRGTVEKYVLREATRHVLTDTVYRRQKHPFLAPPAAASPGGALDDLIQATLRGPAMRRTPFYDHRKVAGMLDALPSLPPADRGAADVALMAMTSICLLGEQFNLSL
jgi:asparagine synthase (glutamine-hydrolysing)